MPLVTIEPGPDSTTNLSIKESCGIGIVGIRRRCGDAEKLLGVSRALAKLGVDASNLRITFLAGKAPQTAPEWLLSLSHSGRSLMAGAVSTRTNRQTMRFGVDIETNRERQYSKLERYLDWVGTSIDGVTFYYRWTLGEALFKAMDTRQRHDDFSKTFAKLDLVRQSRKRRSDVIEAQTDDWLWQAYWPELADGATACVVLGVHSARLAG